MPDTQHVKTLEDYKRLLLNLQKLPDNEQIQMTRYLLRTDLFFLLWYGCGRIDMARPWLMARCKEIQEEPNGYLDLWAREHYKSTIITYGKTLQDIIASHGDDPLPEWGGKEPTFGIFSCTRPLAKGFLRQLKAEFEGNGLLRRAFPDIIWDKPQKHAPKWSEDDGIVLKRISNPKESTVEAWGIIDGQPTGKHFDILIYDDVVTVENVTTPEMIMKTTDRWSLSTNLGSEGGKDRYIGTRYHFNDSYREMIARGAVKPRIYPATQDGTPEGDPVLVSKEYLTEKRIRQGPYIFSCQMLLNPVADESQSLKKEWINFYDGSDGAGMNKYILVDPASSKKKQSDYTVLAVIGLGQDNNYYLLDMIRDRLNLLERSDALFRLHKKWKPNKVGYEQYGMQADIEHIKDKQKRENYRFDISILGGKVAKVDRIKRMIPSLSQGRWYFPNSIFKTNYEGKTQDLIDIFINEEFTAFPVPVHDDMLDALSRIFEEDLLPSWPRMENEDGRRDRYARRAGSTGSAWSA